MGRGRSERQRRPGADAGRDLLLRPLRRRELHHRRLRRAARHGSERRRSLQDAGAFGEAEGVSTPSSLAHATAQEYPFSIKDIYMALYIKDEETAQMVGDLAKRLGTTKRDAVRTAVRAQLEKLSPEPSLRERLESFYKDFPMPEPTGLKADKAFFDDLSGEFD